ncbi:MAG: hypothetical protein HC831_10155 [Chloroflexia bacterium]|nr:hypothetical protein [Chloroflexia bacterium]
MAQLLYEKQSTKVHLNATQRHIRLCKRTTGTEDAITAIEPFYQALIEKQKATEDAGLNRKMVRDDVYHFDNILDDEVISCYEDCKKHDKKDQDRSVLLQLSPDGKYTTITKTRLTDEPDKVGQLVSRIGARGADHPLNSIVEVLNAGIENCRTGLSTYNQSITDEKQPRLKKILSRPTCATNTNLITSIWPENLANVMPTAFSLF